MKKILIFFPILLIAVFFMGCEKEGENVVIKENIAANVLSPMPETSYTLLMDSSATVTGTFEWTKVDFGFPAKITYTVQLDTTGNEFANAVDLITVSSVLSADIIEGELNKILLAAGFQPDKTVTLQFRVKAVVNPKVAPVYSVPIEVIMTPYAVIFPPIFMCGAATGGWVMPDKAVSVRSSAPNVYQTIAYFGPANETFRFFKAPDWGAQAWNFPFFTGSVSALFENANDGDKNLRFLGTPGYYKITVNMTDKSVAMESVPEPKMFMTGAAVGGWDWSTNYVQMTWKSDGIFEATTDFINGGAFRFFAQKDWGPTSYNYPYFAAGSVSPLFVNANDGDKNFSFTGTTGVFKITLNMLTLTVTMQ